MAFIENNIEEFLAKKYPVEIRNRSLYKKCNQNPLSIQILESRWNLFGHILRRNSNISANKAMELYFIKSKENYKGRPLTTLLIILNRDLTNIDEIDLKLKSTTDQAKLTTMASDRQEWKQLVRKIREAAEASKSYDLDAEGFRSGQIKQELDNRI